MRREREREKRERDDKQETERGGGEDRGDYLSLWDMQLSCLLSQQ